MAAPVTVSEQRPFAGLAAPGTLVLGVAAATFLLAYDGGTFGEASRDTLAVAVCWVVVLAAVAGLWPLSRLTRASLLSGGLLAAFAAFTLASAIWSDSAEDAFVEFNRASLYVGTFALAALAGTRARLARWSDGLALGITVTAGLALFTRCFPDVFLTEKNLRFLPLDFTRLSYPLEYWNGLAIFVGLAVPLLLRVTGATGRPLAQALALAPFPVLSSVIFLTSSRGGVATAVLGGLALLVLVPNVRMVGAALVAALGSAAGVASVATRSELVNHPGIDAAGQGHVAFVLVLASCVGTAAVSYCFVRYAAPRLSGRASRVGPLWRGLAVGGIVLLLAAGVAAAHPVRIFDKFRQPPAYALNTLPQTNGALQSHLLSAGSSGRWQQWTVVLNEFESAPLFGRGAGSYEAWWAQHGTLHGYVRDAHSLYLETLGELGVVGFALIVGALATGLAAGARRALSSRGDFRIAVAALWAAFVGYVFAAGIDWMWEMTVVSVVGTVLLGLLTGRASLPEPAPAHPLSLRWQIAGRAVIGVVGLAVVAGLALSLLASREIRASQSAVSRRDLSTAAAHANNARKIEPWASTPYVQLALVSEEAGNYGEAEAWIRKAIARDRSNFRPWVLSARFQLERGDVGAARDALRRARALSPHSDLFAARAGGASR